LPIVDCRCEIDLIEVNVFGRAARNLRGKAILYADRMTDSMKAAIGETDRRRAKQEEYNLEHGIVPTSIKREIMDVMEGARNDPEQGVTAPEKGVSVLTAQQLAKRLNELEAKMFKHAQNLEFEQAAACRDAIAKLKQEALLS
jgi:excinuclease ABC subunit B